MNDVDGPNRIERIPPPRRLRTAYAYFVQSEYHNVARDSGTRRPQPIISRLSEMWRTLSQEQRQEYNAQEQRDRARYEQAKLEWIRQHAGRRRGYMNRKRKDPKLPRRPATAYILFKRAMHEKLREEMPDATAREREKDIINRWRALPIKERDGYKKKAEEDKLRYANELHERVMQERERQIEEQNRQRMEDLAFDAEEADAQPPAPEPAPAPAPAAAEAQPAPALAEAQPPGPAPAEQPPVANQAPAADDPAPAAEPQVVVEAAPAADDGQAPGANNGPAPVANNGPAPANDQQPPAAAQ